MSAKKTVTQSFRLDEKILRRLSKEAQKQRVSLNTIVEHVLEDYVGLGYYIRRDNVLLLGSPLISAIFDEFSDETIRKIGDTFGENHPREILAAFGLPFTLENAVRLLEYQLSYGAHWFKEPEITRETDAWTIHLRHIINRKWSLYLSEYMTTMFKALGFQKMDTSVVDYSTTIRLKTPTQSGASTP